MESIVYNQNGKESGKVSLPETIFNLPWNADLVHQVVTSMLSTRRAGTAHTKDMGEVSGGGKKPWQQKGTGRARHGSRRSPIWRKGGVTHGPRTEKNYDRKVGVVMKRKALYTVLSQKLRDGEILFVDSLNFKEPKTKEAKEVLNSFGQVKGFEALPKKRKNAMMLAIDGKNAPTEKSFRNFSNISVVEARNMNVADIVNYRFLAIVAPEKFVKEVKGIK